MNKVLWLSIYLLLLALALPSAHAAMFNCAIRTTCNSNETLFISLNSSESGQAPNNSHAQLANFSGATYPYSVCCWTDSFRTLNNSCSGNGVSVLNLFNISDSHVEAGFLSNYAYDACLNVTQGNITCQYVNTSCAAGYSPVVSIASSETADNNVTNCHVGDFNLWRTKVCCQIGGQNPPVVAYVNISPNWTAKSNMDLECQNGSVTDADGDAVTLHYNWYRNGTSITLLNLPMDYDSNTGTTHDISGYANHGVVNGATFLPTGGKVGGAFSYDGISSNVNLSNATAFYGNNYTWAVWIYPLSLSTIPKAIISDLDCPGACNSGEAITFGTGIVNNRVAFYSKNRITYAALSSSTFVANQWYFLTVTMNSSNVSIYVNGIYDASGSSNIDLTAGIAPLLLGRHPTNVPGHSLFNGTIDEVIIFNRTLSPNEVLTLYNTNNRFLNRSEIRRSDLWNCSITPVDSTGLNGTTKFSNRTNITGSAPYNVTLLYPVNNNQSVFERYVNFSWTPAVELDGDQVNYSLNVTVTPGGCSNQTQQTNLQITNYTYGDVCVDQLYNWTVQACDIDGCSGWISLNNFTVASVVSFRFINNVTNFGSLAIGQTIDTEFGGVAPFYIVNDGNVQANVSINATNSPFANQGLSTTAFQYKSRVSDSNAFNNSAGGSQMTYTPITAAYTNVVKQLMYNCTQRNGTVFIDVNVTVPLNETPGAKVSNVSLRAVMTVTP